MNKLKKIIARILVVDPIKRGKEVWMILYAGEEKPVGSLVKDDPTVKKFTERARALPFTDYYALTTWLKFAYDDLENNMPEHTTGAIEQYHDKWRQIYRQHIEALKKLDTCK